MTMKRISSRSLVFMKTLFPLLWFGILGSVLVSTIASRAYEQSFMVLAMPCLMAIFGFFLMRKLIWDLADEVYDKGDSLLVRFRGEEEEIPLSAIINVSVAVAMNPPRITLRLAAPGRFGQEIAFSPIKPFTFNPFAPNPIAEDLILRVDQARSRRVADSASH